jgi:hypothetical protein
MRNVFLFFVKYDPCSFIFYFQPQLSSDFTQSKPIHFEYPKNLSTLKIMQIERNTNKKTKIL